MAADRERSCPGDQPDLERAALRNDTPSQPLARLSRCAKSGEELGVMGIPDTPTRVAKAWPGGGALDVDRHRQALGGPRRQQRALARMGEHW